MVGHGGSSAGSYLADPTSPIPSHCASIVATSTVRVNLVWISITRWNITWFLYFSVFLKRYQKLTVRVTESKWIFEHRVWYGVWSSTFAFALFQPRYQELVNDLLSRQSDPAYYQRLAEAFHELTPAGRQLSLDRQGKITFMTSFDKFLINVRGFLCVK